MEGFTVGVAFIISLNQLNFAMGLCKLPGHLHFIDNVVENLSHIPQAQWQVGCACFFGLRVCMCFLRFCM
jgi:MFS superfamily sulfate permease-like transporter